METNIPEMKDSNKQNNDDAVKEMWWKFTLKKKKMKHEIKIKKVWTDREYNVSGLWSECKNAFSLCLSAALRCSISFFTAESMHWISLSNENPITTHNPHL